ncbi:MAG TPA: hypothetical protein VFV37_09940 [Luteibaculaceae bacterium]|nr:hypothetical protein [Luteibaculaceae bacterium]
MSRLVPGTVRIAALCFLCFQSVRIFAQSTDLIEFSDLIAVDTLHKPLDGKRYPKMDSLQRSDCFFSYQHIDSKRGLYSDLLLIKKYSDHWVVYRLDSEWYSSSNRSPERFESARGPFICIWSRRYPSGTCQSITGCLGLLNTETLKYAEFIDYSYSECPGVGGQVTIAQCSSKFEIDEAVIRVKQSSDTAAMDNCFPSGAYRLEREGMVKVGYYNSESAEFENIVCDDAALLCTGMPFSELVSQLKGSSRREVSFRFCAAEENQRAIEFYRGDSTWLRVITNADGLVIAYEVYTPVFSFDGLNTFHTPKEVLDLYPQARIHIDSISDWEYISFPNTSMRLIWQTDPTNRVGHHGKDFEAGTRELERPSAKVDFIEVY